MGHMSLTLHKCTKLSPGCNSNRQSFGRETNQYHFVSNLVFSASYVTCARLMHTLACLMCEQQKNRCDNISPLAFARPKSHHTYCMRGIALPPSSSYVRVCLEANFTPVKYHGFSSANTIRQETSLVLRRLLVPSMTDFALTFCPNHSRQQRRRHHQHNNNILKPSSSSSSSSTGVGGGRYKNSLNSSKTEIRRGKNNYYNFFFFALLADSKVLPLLLRLRRTKKLWFLVHFHALRSMNFNPLATHF